MSATTGASGDTTAPAIWLAFSPDRKGENPRQHLKLYKGALQADAYAGFQHLYESGTIVEVACWAHARRKFHEIHIAHPSSTTTEAIERVVALGRKNYLFVGSNAGGERKKPHPGRMGLLNYAGDHLISHTLTRAVPSAQRGLTSVFGMGTGVTLVVNSPANCRNLAHAIFHN